VAPTARARIVSLDSVQELEVRPLHAWVAGSNLGSIRVLEKCGFVQVGSRAEYDDRFGEVVEELLFELR
jgi:L-amino acid N-acyltransferase YncA